MKTAIQYLTVICVSASVSFGAFDHVISDTYRQVTLTLNSESLLVTGAGAYLIDARGSSYVDVQGTAPLQQFTGGIQILDLDDGSRLELHGGEIGAFYIYDNATAALKGGQIDILHSFQHILTPNQNYIPHIEIVCKEHNFNSSTNRLTGVWMDDTTFNIQLIDVSGYSPAIENIFFTPEPATLLLVGAGGILLRRKGYVTRQA